MPPVIIQHNIGKSGIDGISALLKRICIIVAKYNTKLLAALALLHTAGQLSDDDYATAVAFVDGAKQLCRIFASSADLVGFYNP